MRDGWFINAEGEKVVQPLYFSPDDPNMPGRFMGTSAILKERGYDSDWINNLRAACKGFKCPQLKDGAKPTCCCRRVLFSEPDFATADSLIKETCRERNYDVLFLPKFHCELNPIEQCWGYVKQRYRKLPRSSSEADLERNVVQVLDELPLSVVRKFCQRALRFTDAYHRGLSSKQAVWATKRYHGHRRCPDSVLEDLDKHNIAK
jgi:hypothetical protein